MSLVRRDFRPGFCVRVVVVVVVVVLNKGRRLIRKNKSSRENLTQCLRHDEDVKEDDHRYPAAGRFRRKVSENFFII